MAQRIAISPEYSWRPSPRNVSRMTIANASLDLEPSSGGTVIMWVVDPGTGDVIGNRTFRIEPDAAQTVRAQLLELARVAVEAEVQANPPRDENGEPVNVSVTIVDE